MADVDPTLRVSNLTVAYRNGNGWLEAVRDVSFDVQPGQACGLIGESGSGKTTVALAIMRYLPREGSVRGGSIALDGRDLLALRPGQMSAIWGSRLALVPQDPLAALNPSLRLGQQLGEVLQHHQGLRRQDADRRVRELFASVRLADPDRVARAYPHQVSGGMLQRVMIAMALSTEPRLLILDEPTSSLDVTTQATVLDLIRDLIREHRTSVLHISHNLGVLAQSSDRVEVLYAGELIEEGDTLDIYGQPLHPYTRGLLDSVPRLGVSKGRVRVRAIQGRIPGPGERPEGCIFRPRCPLAIEVCRIHPPLYDCGDGRRSRCHRWAEIQAHAVSARQPAPALPEESAREVVGQETVLGVQDLEVTFREPGAGLRALLGRPAAVRAVDGVGLRVRRGRTVGLVGESGSGKTSLARAITGLVERSGGTVTLHDHPLPRGLRGRDRETRRRLQMVFQNPEEALNPFHTVGEALRRPLMRLRGQSARGAEEGARALLAQVQLDPEYAGRLPAELSGGEKQRVAIARAFAT
ncbi:MAG: ABC transporter ATP-binding protein, partial [Chloroflexi bacterium]|nr:ABC transporter ATP-binding protein [Chloroflexota bacterium]